LCNAKQSSLKITFHNNNTKEELAKCIIKLMAKESAEDLFYKAGQINGGEGLFEPGDSANQPEGLRQGHFNL